MNLRPTQAGTYNLVRMGLSRNTRLLTQFQEQVASGKRILRVSDDVVGATRALSVRRQMESVGRHRDSIAAGRSRVDFAASALERGSSIITEARALMIQGMNGTLNQADRNTIASQIEQAIGELFDTANTESNGAYLFAGTESEKPAYERRTVAGREQIVYAGNEDHHRLTVGATDDATLNVHGQETFSRFEYTGATLEGLTGLRLGTSANQGTGDAYIELRRDGVTGAPGAGVVFANGGANDTFLGAHQIEINAADRTVSFDGGEPKSISTPLPSDMVLYGDNGAEVHLDFTGWTGVDRVSTVTGEGSVSIDGSTFTPLATMGADLRLVHPDSGDVVHVDVRSVRRSGRELVQFEGTVDLFSALQGAVDDLRNSDGLNAAEITSRLEMRLGEVDRGADNVLASLGRLGGTSARLINAEDERASLDTSLQSRLSELEDADFAEVVLDLTRAEQTLQLAQASGSRLIQTSLLNFLG